jgi:3-mercaptopyruvate sulfurtransferase SseA
MSARNGRASLIPLIMVGLGIILMISSMFWFLNSARKTAASQTGQAAPISSPRIPYPEIRRVSLADAKAAFDLKQAMFIDARGEPYFSQGHIPGAVSMTPDEISSRLSELDPNAWIITYCT